MCGLAYNDITGSDHQKKSNTSGWQKKKEAQSDRNRNWKTAKLLWTVRGKGGHVDVVIRGTHNSHFLGVKLSKPRPKQK